MSDSDTLAAWEIAALFRGAISVDALNVDRDAAVAQFIAEQLAEDLREDYRAELQMAEDEMFEVFSSDLSNLVRTRAAALGDHYPFTLDDAGRLVPKALGEISSVGGAYLGLQFYRAWNSGLIEVEAPDEDTRKKLHSKFNTWFPKLFEILASYAVAGHQTGVPHITAHCRSSQRLHRMLVSLCSRVGAGRAKRYEDWTPAQKASNDGGIDCIVHIGGPGMPGHAYLVLVGATVQASQIDKKIVGQDVRGRFSDFFAERPAAFMGALVRPVDEDPLTTDKCKGRDCLLYTYNSIWENIGKRSNQQASRRYFSQLDARVRSLLRLLDGATLVDEFDEYKLAVA